MTAASETPDVVLIGAGIMSATLGTLLKELEPTLDVVMFETLDDCAQESSEAWNNAGTGHAANCELNYTPQRSDGSVDISKALEVNTEFDLSRQLWSHLVTKGAIPDPRTFLEPCPHMSFVWGDENVAFLRERYNAMSAHHCYEGMEYSEDRGEIAQWVPLVMEGRDKDQPVAATRMITGTDVDYGALTHLLVSQLQAQPGFSLHYKHKVVDLDRRDDGRWGVTVEDVETGDKRTVAAKFVFVGAGGGALELLEKSKIPEGHGYGGFPVSGIWLRCDVDEVSARHHAKVYGKAATGSPPMSVPHRRQAVAALRPLCGLFQQVPEAWFPLGPVPLDRARQRPADAGGGARQPTIDRVSDRPGTADRGASIRDAQAVLPAGAAA
jgi:malate dehydrogenase (quinone)